MYAEPDKPPSRTAVESGDSGTIAVVPECSEYRLTRESCIVTCLQLGATEPRTSTAAT